MDYLFKGYFFWIKSKLDFESQNKEQSGSTWHCLLGSKWVWCFIGQELCICLEAWPGRTKLHRGHRCYSSEWKHVLIAFACVLLNSYAYSGIIHVHLYFYRWQLFLLQAMFVLICFSVLWEVCVISNFMLLCYYYEYSLYEYSKFQVDNYLFM